MLNTEIAQNNINCLNGIRSLNALALLIFHKSAALFFNPYVNRTYMSEVKEFYSLMLFSDNQIKLFILSDKYIYFISNQLATLPLVWAVGGQGYTDVICKRKGRKCQPIVVRENNEPTKYTTNSITERVFSTILYKHISL